MDSDEYKDLFLAEAKEYLQIINDCLLELERRPDDKEVLAEIFRASHSLKGMSGTMGYDNIGRLTHEMESALERLRSGQAMADTQVINLLFRSLDLLHGLLETSDEPETSQEDLNNVVTELRKTGDGQQIGGQDILWEKIFKPDGFDKKELSAILDEYDKEILKEVKSENSVAYLIRILLYEGSLLKSVRAYMVLKAVEEHGEVIKTFPSLSDLEEERFGREFFLLLIGPPEPEKLKHVIMRIAEIEETDIRPFDFEEDVAFQGEMEQGKENESSSCSVKQNNYSKPALSKMKDSSPPRATWRKNSEKTVRVETEKLDNLINLVGELVINRTRVSELSKEMVEGEMHDALEHLDRVITDLQSAVMKLRMVPIKQVFDRFPRMVRDLCQERGKDVQLIISGEETELDRTIVNEIADPLVHLFRNAVDHGIEPLEQRRRSNKEDTAKIELEAYHEGSHVVIVVKDDGAGIDPDTIRNKAVEKGIFSLEEAKSLTDEEALHLIFNNGFSTAPEVTDVSGRGVGMDAVKSAVEALNGTVDIKSKKGKGTLIFLRLPLTLAIIRALLVKAGGNTYAIPIEAIKENLYVEPEGIKSIQKERVITLREEVLPLYFLEEQLGLGQNNCNGTYSVVIVETAGRKAGLVVDLLLGQQEIVIKSLRRYFNNLKGVAGATVLGDGRVALILDVADLIENGRVEFGEKSINYG